ncbi:MAG: DUF2142 domain-containing protein [Verrucomicrobiae bacterium]|nr:DUF2142 domain-containing protein [Verrucomicrobiae bacterium]
MNQIPAVNRFLGLFLILFFAKAVFVSLFVTPPWDVPDEIGHLGYVKELATGKGVPVFRETRMDTEMWDHMAGASGASPDYNWIAQHPPLYYLYMVPSYWVGELLGDGFQYPLHTGRIWNACLMVLALYLVYRICLDYSGKQMPAFLLAVGVGSIPMVTQTAAGVNNDTMIIALSTAIGWRWMHFYQRPNRRNLLWLGLVLGLGGITKYTLLVVMAPVSAFSILYAFRAGKRMVLPVAGFVMLGWAPISLWALRNVIVLGKAMPTSLEYLDFPTKTHYTVLEFFEAYPFFTHMFRSFWGIFGWHGSGQDLNLTTLHIPVVYQCFYAVLLSVFVLASLACLVAETQRKGRFSGKFLFVIPALFTLGIYLIGPFPREAFYVKQVVYLGIYSSLFSLYFGILRIWMPGVRWEQWESRLQVEALVVSAFFTAIIVMQMISYSNDSGMLRGTHGRYFFAVFGCLLLGWMVPGLNKLARFNWICGVLVLAMVLGESWLWLDSVIPFFVAR